jgi:RecB family endonuclease NucS
MPVKFGLWRIDGSDATEVLPAALDSEKRLEDIVEKGPEILGLGDLMQIGRQVMTDFGKRIDLLAINAEGDLLVIELKRDRTPREVVAQALEYGFWIESLTYDEVAALYAHHHDGEDFDSAFTERFEIEMPEVINAAHELFVLAAGVDSSTEQIVDYLRGYGVPVNVLLFSYL